MNTASILGVQFHAVTKQQAVDLAMSKLRARQKGYVVTPNPEIVELCRRDPEFMGIVNHAALVLPTASALSMRRRYSAKLCRTAFRALNLPRNSARPWRRRICGFICSAQSPASQKRPVQTCARNIPVWFWPVRTTATFKTRSRLLTPSTPRRRGCRIRLPRRTQAGEIHCREPG